MRQPRTAAQREKADPKFGAWQQRSPFERRTDQDSRRKTSAQYFRDGGLERRSGKERRQAAERRDRWLRVGMWRSELVFDE